jgi:hypothetical protein
MNRALTVAASVLLVLSVCAARVRAADEVAPTALAVEVKPAEKPAKKQAAKKADNKKKEVRPGLVENLVVAPANQNDAMVQQWAGQFRPALLAELTFIRQTVELSKDQRPKIKAAGEASLVEAAKEFADFQQGRRVVQRRAGAPAATQPDPQSVIREGLAKSLKETLTAEQFAHFTEEINARNDHRKRAAILCVVSRLDGMLCLTAEQREAISSDLAAEWQERWEHWLSIQNYGDQYFPQVPDKQVDKHLTPDQKAVWNGLQKVDFGFSPNHVAQQVEDAEWWDGEAAAKPAAPAMFKALGNWLRGNR